MFDLAPVDRYRLARPPLVQALGQIRYPLRARLQTLDGVAPLQDRLLDVFPYMNQEQVQQVSLLVGPGMAPASEAQTARTWRFTDDLGWTLIVAADAATLSIGPQYGLFRGVSRSFRDHRRGTTQGRGPSAMRSRGPSLRGHRPDASRKRRGVMGVVPA